MRTTSSKVLTPDGWVRVYRLVVRVFGKEITLRTTVEKIIIPYNVLELEKKAFKECLHDTEEMRKMIEWREKMKLRRLSDEEFDLILNTRF